MLFAWSTRVLLLALVLGFYWQALAQDSTVDPGHRRNDSLTTFREYPISFAEQANATAATATATHTGVAGSNHYITNVIWDCVGGTAVPTARLLDGATLAVTVGITTGATSPPFQMTFANPYRITAGNDAVADLTTCGVGIVGHVTIFGYTLTDK